MLSVNQINAQVKILEMWKATHIDSYPIKTEQKSESADKINTRVVSSGNLIKKGFSSTSQNTFLNDATRAWNKTPLTIKSCKSLFSAKKQIKEFVLTLPI